MVKLQQTIKWAICRGEGKLFAALIAMTVVGMCNLKYRQYWHRSDLRNHVKLKVIEYVLLKIKD